MALASASRFRALSVAVLCFSLCGCDFMEAKQKFDDFLLRAIGRGDLVGVKGKNASQSTNSLAGKTNEEAAKQNRMNAELLHEVFKTVLMRDPETPGEFATLLGSLNQGASFEGIYNGMVHSASYRDVEQQSPNAKPEALRVFSTELQVLQQDMDQPTQFNAEAAKPLAKAVEPTGDDNPTNGAGQPVPDSNGVATLDFNQQGKDSVLKDSHPSADQLAQVFVGASVFTLKRVLGDEALKLIDEKRANPDALAKWYAKWVVHMASLKVDFGLPLRNKADEKFHYDWARSSSEDLLIWEVLNRVHRVVNSAHWKKP